MNDIKESEYTKAVKLNNRLLAQLLTQDKESNAEKIGLFERNGFKPSEIAELLNLKLNYVTATLSYIRKSGLKKQKPKGG